MKLRTKVAALGVAAATIGTAGAVFAAWTSTASGSGSAASTTSIDGAISAASPDSSGTLYPGAVKSAFVTITNPNDYPVIVTKVYAGSSTASGDCVADTVRTDERSAAGGLNKDLAGSTPTVIAPKVGATPGSAVFELTLRMSNTATDDCKSKSFTIGDLAADDGTGSGQDAVVTTALHADISSAATTAGNNF